MNSALEVKNLSKHYENFDLKDVCLNVPKGSIVGLVGQNGAGKTTLIKLIFEVIKKDSGTVKILDKNDVGVVLDDSFFPEILKVGDIDNIMKGIYKNWDEKLFSNYLKDFNLNKNQKIKELSKGMKKKLEIITALSHHPKLLVLDEPTSGLDPIVRKEVLDMFLSFVEDEQNSILLSSHITSDIENIADYVIFINEGKIIFEKSVIDLKESFAVAKCTEKDFEKIDKKYVVKYKKNKYDYEVLITNVKDVKRKYKNLVIDKALVEDIMLLYVKGE